MILVDLNQVMISNIMVQLKFHGGELSEDLIRHMVLNSIRSYNSQFRQGYGEMIICCDNRQYWRREFFPHYKAGRKKERAGSTYDWNLIFNTIERLKGEIREYLGYRVIDVPHAEADDIIGTLTPLLCTKEPVLILSSDKDFLQLQKYPNVEQYNPVLKKFISTNNPEHYVREHVLRGDVGDGIPNALSADDIFVSGGRQKPIATKKLMEWINTDTKDLLSDPVLGYGYSRNRTLIDLEQIPQEVSNAVVKQFYEQKRTHNKMKVMDYFIKFNLRKLNEKLGDF